ncbi:E3 ubiquitin ligase BIG BROTHER-related-like isoform X2 [Maniola jurtina]|uniref:E3 ubiquitin ligase BIG BROTHER-related-like isoform X2 n=1 Tax=Maniola jurtina TaxID=191418 RepID=UPI001E68B240|nr:E3 ubiquitin ligase BIG BROTHER-related-like isoform X2 [Maniola jurtina]
MSLREEDKQKSGCSSRGLGLAAAAIGVGIGAALYYIFSKEESRETPDSEGATSAQWNVESPQPLNEDHNSSNDHTTISENTTSDTSMYDDSLDPPSSDHEEIVPSDDSYNPISSSESDCSNDLNGSWVTDVSDPDWMIDTLPSESDANLMINESGWTINSRDEPSFASSESDANYEFSSNLMNNEFDTDGAVNTRDEPSSPSSESDANNQFNSNLVTNDIDRVEPMDTSEDLPSRSNALRTLLLNNERIANAPYMDIRDPESSESEYDNWDVASSIHVPHLAHPTSSRLGCIVRLLTPRRPARPQKNERSSRRSQAFRERTWSLEECSICFEVILKNQEVMSLPCTHNFHQSCILPWIQEHQTCPNCRKAVD